MAQEIEVTSLIEAITATKPSKRIGRITYEYPNYISCEVDKGVDAEGFGISINFGSQGFFDDMNHWSWDPTENQNLGNGACGSFDSNGSAQEIAKLFWDSVETEYTLAGAGEACGACGVQYTFFHECDQEILKELAKAIPVECAEFVEHPHIVVTEVQLPDGSRDWRRSGCYTCQCALESQEQGVSEIAEMLIKSGIKNVRIDQTGGFNMVIYIGDREGRNVALNSECIGVLVDPEKDTEYDLAFFAEGTTPDEILASVRARLDGVKQD